MRKSTTPTVPAGNTLANVDNFPTTRIVAIVCRCGNPIIKCTSPACQFHGYMHRDTLKHACEVQLGMRRYASPIEITKLHTPHSEPAERRRRR